MGWSNKPLLFVLFKLPIYLLYWSIKILQFLSSDHVISQLNSSPRAKIRSFKITGKWMSECHNEFVFFLLFHLKRLPNLTLFPRTIYNCIDCVMFYVLRNFNLFLARLPPPFNFATSPISLFVRGLLFVPTTEINISSIQRAKSFYRHRSLTAQIPNWISETYCLILSSSVDLYDLS